MSVVCLGNSSAHRADAATNILVNGGFETGTFAGWSVSGAAITTSSVYSGQYAARFVGAAGINQSFNTVSGRSYKVTAWVRLISETGDDWGGFSIGVTDYQTWTDLAASPYFTTSEFGTNWFKYSFTFVAIDSQSRLSIEYFGGTGRVMVVHVDNVGVFERSAPNALPDVSFLVSPLNVTNVPAFQSFSVVGDDPDGAILLADWDFGDGTLSQNMTGTRRVGVPGVYTARARVADDDHGVVETNITWTASAPGWPTVMITNVVIAPTALVQGTASGTGMVMVRISTDREIFVDAAGTSSWSAQVPLSPGWNRLLAQVHQADGKVVTHEMPVRFISTGELAVAVRALSPTVAERWEPVEVHFDILNSDATHPQFPYETNLPRGVEFVDGVTADAVFSPDGGVTTFRVPAFQNRLYQIEERENTEWMIPTGLVWTARFAPPRDGMWSVRIEVTEAKGSAVSDWQYFSVIAPTNPLNHGPLHVATNDWRFYEFADGSPFLGSGFGLPFDRDRLSLGATQFFAEVGVSNANYFRFWASGLIWGNSWQPWNSRTLPAEGTVMAYMLSLDSAYGHALGAFKLDVNPSDWNDPGYNPLIFQGFQGQSASLVPGKRYAIRVRWRTENVTGPASPGLYGVTVKLTGWPDPGQTTNYPPIVPHVFGDTPWHVAVGVFTASTYVAPFLVVALENVTGGRAFVDECAVHEILQDGRYGPALNGLPRVAGHLEFNLRNGASLDRLYREAQRYGMYIRMLIAEKQEWALNHLAPSGLRDRRSGHFNEPATNSPTVKLHEWYWRHLSARFGAFRSLAGLEFVNEEAPGPTDHFRLLGHMARWWNRQAHRKPVSTSTWFGLASNAWTAEFALDAHATDFHAYTVGNWLYPDEHPAVLYDSANYYAEFSRSWYEAHFGKPGHWGECSLYTTNNGEHPAVALDTNGVWLHKWIWARCGEAFVYPTYWYTDNIRTAKLYSLYGNWNRFMDGVPLANSRYQDVAATSAHARLRLIGQKDIPAGHAFLWMDNRDHTWWRVVNGWTVTGITASVYIPMARPGATYRVKVVNTRTGNAAFTNSVSADAAGVVRIAVTNLTQDVAAHLYLDGDSNWDGDGDGLPDQWEVRYVHRLDLMNQFTDLDGDGFPDVAEYRAGTDPSDASSYLKVYADTDRIRWPSASGRLYRVQYTENLVTGPWTSLLNDVAGTPPTNTYTIELQDGFYRVLLREP